MWKNTAGDQNTSMFCFLFVFCFPEQKPKYIQSNREKATHLIFEKLETKDGDDL